jgi:putative ABC transport system permease protein
VGIGGFSIIAYTVSQQTREIAVRIALGATRRDVLGSVLLFGARLLGIGIIAGLIASFAANRLLVHQLWGVSAHDPATIAAAVALVTLVALFACYLPARRAIRIEPMAALRSD